MVLTFKYEQGIRPSGSFVRSPLIPLLLSGTKTIPTIGLVDSGADVSVISKGLAELMGLNLNGIVHTASGIGGEVSIVESRMSLTVEKPHEKHTFLLPVKVVMNDDCPVILGRDGFFDKFVITFDQSREKLYLKRVVNQWNA